MARHDSLAVWSIACQSCILVVPARLLQSIDTAAAAAAASTAVVGIMRRLQLRFDRDCRSTCSPSEKRKFVSVLGCGRLHVYWDNLHHSNPYMEKLWLWHNHTPPLVGDLSPFVPNERVSSNVYFTCPVLCVRLTFPAGAIHQQT